MITFEFLLAAFGLAWIVGHSYISLPFRRWLGGYVVEVEVTGQSGAKFTQRIIHKGHLGRLGPFLCKMCECPGCFGFHIGWIYALGYMRGAGEPVNVGKLIIAGAAVAASNFIIGRITRLDE